MLIKNIIPRQIKQGDITLAFQRWHRPTIRAGGTIKTTTGVLKSKNTEEVDPAEVFDKKGRIGRTQNMAIRKQAAR